MYRGVYYLVNPILLKNDAAFQDRMYVSVVPQVLQQHASHVHAVPRLILHAIPSKCPIRYHVGNV